MEKSFAIAQKAYDTGNKMNKTCTRFMCWNLKISIK